jgi:hypothetical protein
MHAMIARMESDALFTLSVVLMQPANQSGLCYRGLRRRMGYLLKRRKAGLTTMNAGTSTKDSMLCAILNHCYWIQVAAEASSEHNRKSYPIY